MNPLARAASGVAAVALGAAAMWLTNVKPHIEDREQDPISTSGAIGKVVHNRIFDARVDRVDVAAGIAKSLGNQVLRSPGIFVIVYVSVRSNREPVNIGHTRIRTRDGLSYEESGLAGLYTGAGQKFQPMIWGKTRFVYELPRDQLVGAHVIMGQADSLITSLSAVVDIDLGLDDRKAARLLANPPSAYRLPSSTS